MNGELFNYNELFDYILTEWFSQDDEMDDLDKFNDIYSEMGVLYEFNEYCIQEGIGTKLLIGVGLAALIGTVIVVLLKIISDKSSNGLKTVVDSCGKEYKVALKNGVKFVSVDKWISDDGIKLIKAGLFLIESCSTKFKIAIDKYSDFIGAYRHNNPDEISEYRDELNKILSSENEKVENKIRSILSGTKFNYDDIFEKSNKSEIFNEVSQMNMPTIMERISLLKEFTNDIKNTIRELNRLKNKTEALDEELQSYGVEPCTPLKDSVADILKVSENMKSILLQHAKSIRQSFDAGSQTHVNAFDRDEYHIVDNYDTDQFY